MKWFKTQGAVFAIILALVTAAWSYLLYQYRRMSAQPMSEMWMPPSEFSAWGLTDFAFVYAMWAVMMTAMMLPTSIPMLTAYGRVSRRLSTTPGQSLGLFAGAYLGLWLLFSIVPTILQWQLHGLAWLSPMMENQNRLFAAGILLLAGVYQFTPIKNACLTHCKSPLGFLLNEWRDGRAGALKMGLTHGVNCIGCCWAQMLIMFVVGVMNLPAMALLTLAVIAEKLIPL
ncbi:MAG: DUF2182 domain-containing protein, partial [Methylococcaceae bacterium]